MKLDINNKIYIEVARDEKYINLLQITVNYNIHEVAVQVRESSLYSFMLELDSLYHTGLIKYSSNSKRYREFIKSVNDKYNSYALY